MKIKTSFGQIINNNKVAARIQILNNNKNIFWKINHLKYKIL